MNPKSRGAYRPGKSFFSSQFPSIELIKIETNNIIIKSNEASIFVHSVNFEAELSKENPGFRCSVSKIVSVGRRIARTGVPGKRSGTEERGEEERRKHTFRGTRYIHRKVGCDVNGRIHSHL